MKKIVKSIGSYLLEKRTTFPTVGKAFQKGEKMSGSVVRNHGEIAALKSYADKIANDSLSYLNFNGERIDRLQCNIWEGNQQLLGRFYAERATRPIKVVFLVADTSLWDVYHPIYMQLAKDPAFAPRVIAFRRVDILADKSAAEVAEFFAALGVAVEIAGYDDKPYPPLDASSADVIFYTLGSVAYPEAYRIEYTSLFCRTCYLSYGFLLANEFDYQFNQSFHHAAWTVFASTQREVDLYSSFNKRHQGNVVQAAYPKLELLDRRTHETTKPSRPVVIWAPHWTVGLVYTRLNFGTFDQFYKGMLALFSMNEGIDFVFKPHPNLLFALKTTGLMDEGEYANYLSTLEAMPNVTIWQHGGYTELFLRSSAMITDSISFLAEYIPTGNPLLFLDRKDRVPLADVGEQIIDLHYQGSSIRDVRTFVQSVVVDGDDKQRDKRLTVGESLLGLSGETGTQAIHNHLKRNFNLS